MAVEAAGEVLGGARELRVLVGGRVAGLLVEVAALVLAPGHGFEGAVVCDLEPVGIFKQGEGESGGRKKLKFFNHICKPLGFSF